MRKSARFSVARCFPACAAGAWLCWACQVPAESPETSLVGRTLTTLNLRDPQGRLHALEDYRQQPLVVVAFLGVECPLAKLYAPRLAELASEYARRGVAFWVVNSNLQDTPTEMAAFARQQGLEFPQLKDPDHQLADLLGATRTPQVFVLDAARVVQYAGRIDDQYSIGIQRRAPQRRDLAAALEDLLAQRTVKLPQTTAVGCLIGRSPRVPPTGDVTYCNQVARILNRRCVGCHRPGEVGPFPLTDFESASAWSEMIREVVSARRMPPWLADPAHGRFANDARLSDEELTQLIAWVEHGTPEGDRQQLPPPPTFAEGWQIAQPDRVFAMRDEPFEVQATGVEEYQSFAVDPGFTSDVWIQAAEARPGNRAVVHHHLAYFVPPGGDRQMSQVKHQIAGYAPGTPPFIYPPGTALRIPAGSQIVFQMHYTPNGTPQSDRSLLGLVLAKPGSVRREVRNEITGDINLHIPPGAAEYRLEASRKFRKDVLLLNLAPHMHLRGKAFRFELERPDGQRAVLLDVPRYDFNWQLRYDLAEPLLIPLGSRLHCFAVFDNSADNPHNPDPTVEVTFGEQTFNEMMFGVYQTLPVDEVPVTSTGGGQ